MVSVESLLSEVTTLFGYQLTLRAADELFFGDKMLYHYHSNDGSKKGISDRSSPNCMNKRRNQEGKCPSNSMHEKPDGSDGLRDAIANARKTLKRALDDTSEDLAGNALAKLTGEVVALKKVSDEMRNEIQKLREDFQKILNYAHQGHEISLPALIKESSEIQKPLEVSKEDFDLFESSDEDDAEKERIKQERLKAYAEKKAKKPGCIAKSSIILDVKPWDDTTDMQEMEKFVRRIEKDGLVWGAAKLIPLAYGIKVLQIICVVEDEKVSVDDLIEQITEEVSDHVQSVDIVAFNKI
ncbi:EF-1 guanine nucleotide exchange domain containing protein [Brugia malayi]|uniref:BMA-EEF-1B.2, isoform b n=1 Tax=Brugia malayi TaxID=6279 RepID=A0A0H5S200_BRUMA|nr:EF-1 guanine nucleotide exchange domain containing protein [Brugia malayi]CRZ22713.1 BMA-EEF-1B.2, isoform b [Brugia malayi]VIO88568.1 EF-1 guanine nucleotide exchange domain containing protein [Brugia malayi]